MSAADQPAWAPFFDGPACPLSPARSMILRELLARIQADIAGAETLLLVGSFIDGVNPLDIDLLAIFPDAGGFRRSLIVERVAGLKAEVFLETPQSLRQRLALEQRHNLHGLRLMLESGVSLLPASGSSLVALRDHARVLARQAPAPASRAYLGSQFEQATRCLTRSTAPAERLAFSIELLQLLRQTFHLLRREPTEGSLKHFFRRLRAQEPAFLDALLQAFSDSCSGDSHALPELLRPWLTAQRLHARTSLLMNAQGVHVRCRETGP